MIHCPQCSREMKQVTARANAGQLIVLDQCEQCGGVWCDKWELFPIEFDEAERIDALNQELLQLALPLTQKPLYCPRCTARLQVFAEPMLPKDVHLQRCGRCDGIWLNRCQLRAFKKFQKQTRESKLGAQTIAKLPAAFENPKSWIVTGTEGMFAYPRGAQEPDDVVEKSLSGAAKAVLETLLRLVIGI